MRVPSPTIWKGTLKTFINEGAITANYRIQEGTLPLAIGTGKTNAISKGSILVKEIKAYLIYLTKKLSSSPQGILCISRVVYATTPIETKELPTRKLVLI